MLARDYFEFGGEEACNEMGFICASPKRDSFEGAGSFFVCYLRGRGKDHLACILKGCERLFHVGTIIFYGGFGEFRKVA